MTDMLNGVFTAIVTPFADEGIDWDALGALVEAQIDEGIHGIVPCGTTGESPTLAPAEHTQVIEFVVERVRGRVPVLAGTGSNSTREAVEYTRHARECGADAALVVLPYYNKPTPSGVIAHFKAIAGEGLPIVAYNIPSRTGIGLTIETYRALAAIPQVVATKEAAGLPALVDAILTETRLKVFSGDDAMTFPFMCLGAHGVISVASNVAPRGIVDLYDYIVEGNIAKAREQHRRLLPLMTALFIETNPIPVKAMLALLGRIEDILRPPLFPAAPATRTALQKVLSDSSDLLLRP